MLGALIRRPYITAAFLLLVLGAAVPAAAQTGTVRGKVVDEKGQPVAGAVIRIEAVDGMGRKFQVKSNNRGEFVQIGLAPGQYRFTAEKDGLKDMAERRVSLDELALEFTLRKPGAADMSDEERKKAEARIAAVKGNFADGVAFANQGKHDEAIAKFNEVLAEAPKCVECYTNIAAVHVQKKEYDEAEAAYKKALEIAPSSAEAYSGLANLYNAQKRFDEAAEASAQAAKLGAAAPGGASASVVFNQGVIAWNASRIPEAKKAFEEAVRLDPKMADAHYWLGMAHLNEGNMPEAAKAFQAYLDIAPTGQYAEQAKGILGTIKP
jgi:tetratricopeptide (TPR) repeat protein